MTSRESAVDDAIKPRFLGSLTLKKNEKTIRILERIYGADAQSQLASFQKANPNLANPDEVKAGNTVVFPARAAALPAMRASRYWIQIVRLKVLSDAYEFVMDAPGAPDFLLLPFWNQREGLNYAVLLKKGFKEEGAARTALKDLAPPYRLLARIVDGWGEDSVFL